MRASLVLCTVLAVGGLVQAQSGDPDANAPGRWRATGDLVTARSYHTATLLLNGQVLAAGGTGGGASAELYDPATRGMDSYWQHGHCTRKPNRDVAAERTGTGGWRYW
jgi:hypothetical protein